MVLLIVVVDAIKMIEVEVEFDAEESKENRVKTQEE